MNNENDKYTALISQIKATQVSIPDPQKLTLQMMQRIENLPQKRNNKTLLFVSWASSIAASLLIGLFVFEQFTLSNNTENRTSAYISSAYEKSVFMDKSTTLADLNTWMQLKKERQKKQETINSIINKYKTL
jgi:hypothetical protein